MCWNERECCGSGTKRMESQVSGDKGPNELQGLIDDLCDHEEIVCYDVVSV